MSWRSRKSFEFVKSRIFSIWQTCLPSAMLHTSSRQESSKFKIVKICKWLISKTISFSLSYLVKNTQCEWDNNRESWYKFIYSWMVRWSSRALSWIAICEIDRNSQHNDLDRQYQGANNCTNRSAADHALQRYFWCFGGPAGTAARVGTEIPPLCRNLVHSCLRSAGTTKLRLRQLRVCTCFAHSPIDWLMWGSTDWWLSSHIVLGTVPLQTGHLQGAVHWLTCSELANLNISELAGIVEHITRK